ncbi:hypothetical protein DV515_00006600, partial [Chloebia gouldiae]
PLAHMPSTDGHSVQKPTLPISSQACPGATCEASQTHDTNCGAAHTFLCASDPSQQADAILWDEASGTISPDLVPVDMMEIRSSSVETFLAELEGNCFQIQAGPFGQWECVHTHLVTTNTIPPILGAAL